MAIFMNAKGTTQPSFSIGKRGNKIFGGVTTPTGADVSSGDIWLDNANSKLKIASVQDAIVSWNTFSTNSNTLVIDDANSSVTVNNDLTVSGNLTVNGTQTIISTTTLEVEDNIVTLNSAFTGADNIANGGIEMNRGDEPNVSLLWDEAEGEWTLGSEQLVAGGFIGNLHGNVIGSLAPNGVPNSVVANTLTAGNATFSEQVSFNGTGNSVLISDTLRIAETGSGLRMTGVGAFDNSGGDFRIFSTANLILSTNGDSGTAVTFDQSTKDAVFQGNIVVNNLTYPTVDGTADQVLVTDGNGTLSFTTVNANPGGSNTQVQFNNADSFGASTGFTFDDSGDILSTGIIKSISFEQLTDYAVIADSSNIASDLGSIASNVGAKIDQGLVVTDYGYPILPSVNVANLPSGQTAGTFLFCPNESGGATIVFYDGTNWRRSSDNGIVS